MSHKEVSSVESKVESTMSTYAGQKWPHELESFETDRWRLCVQSTPQGLPHDVEQLRRQVYVEEWGIMDHDHVICGNDFLGVHILLYDKLTNSLVACTHIVEAELSDFVEQSGVSPRDLSESVLSSRTTIAKPFRSRSLFQLLVYAAVRHFRIQGRKFVVSYLQDGDHPTHKRFKMELIPHAKTRVVDLPNRHQVTLSPHAVSIEYAMYRSSLDLSDDVAALCRLLSVSEIEYTVKKWAGEVNASAIWQRAQAGTLTKHQYAEFLAQLHHFVRNTTRVIAHAISKSEHKVLQKHFRKHMVEEVDHESIIESDLATLGVDADYYTKGIGAHPGIWKFNGLQEALLAYRSNPVLYMAVPFAVEGISAFISDKNVAALKNCARSWGYSAPEKVMRFLDSHREFDGQDGGHWEMTLDMIRRFVSSERDTKDFLAIARATIDNMLEMINETASQNDAMNWTILEGSAVSRSQNI